MILVSISRILGYIENEILISHKYYDEVETISNDNVYQFNDILCIPSERQRDRHLEVVFDRDHDASCYDYLTRFDKKYNDICAVRERSSREKVRNELQILNTNEYIAKKYCKEVMLSEYLKKIIDEYPDIYNVPLNIIVKYCEDLLRLGFLLPEHITDLELLYYFRIFIISGYAFYAKRLSLYILAKYQNIDISEESRIIELQLNAVYAIYEEDRKKMCKYLEQIPNGFLSDIIRGVILFFEKKYEKSEEALRACFNVSDSVFWINYYLGMISMIKSDMTKAKEWFKESINCTAFMPWINLALKRINELNV